jgi:hypothetical protein
MNTTDASTLAVPGDRSVLRLSRADLPMMVEFDQTTYVLVLTKSDKLLLQKPQLPFGCNQEA